MLNQIIKPIKPANPTTPKQDEIGINEKVNKLNLKNIIKCQT